MLLKNRRVRQCITARILCTHQNKYRLLILQENVDSNLLHKSQLAVIHSVRSRVIASVLGV